MEILADAYLYWAAHGPPKDHAPDAQDWEFTVISFKGMALIHCAKNDPNHTFYRLQNTNILSSPQS